jgi:hypothetical protein
LGIEGEREMPRRLDFDDSTKQFVQMCRTKVREHEVSIGTINEMMNALLGEIAKKAGMVGNLKMAEDGTYLELPDPPKQPTK